MIDPDLFHSFAKQALIERLVRLVATDIPKTPRLLMKKRSPQELAGLQHAVTDRLGRAQKPIIDKAHGLLDKKLVNSPRLNKALKKGTEGLVRHPDVAVLAAAPGGSLAAPVYLKGKQGLERLIDKHLPAHRG